jgi:hypothetical protein
VSQMLLLTHRLFSFDPVVLSFARPSGDALF